MNVTGRADSVRVTSTPPTTSLPAGRQRGSLSALWAHVLAICILTPLFSAPSNSRTLLVGPTRTYTSLQQITNLLEPGDTVLVDGDTSYQGGVSFTRAGSPSARILIRGIMVNGNRPLLQGGANTVAFIDGADHYTFENFEVTGGTNRCVYHQSDDLILRNLVVHDCPNQGILGADNGSGSLLLEYSEIYGCGSGTQAHQIYMATDEETHPGSVFRMQYNWIHDGNGGNNVKSRAERNEIYYNWIEGGFYHELELIGPDPAGGVPPDLKREDSDVVGNVLWKKPSGGGSGTFYVVRFGGDGTGASAGRYRFVNNTVIMGTSAAFRLFDALESVEMHNNVFHLPAGGSAPLVRTVEAAWTGGEVIAGENNWVHAGLTAVPAQWTGTLVGTDPAFEDYEAGNLIPAVGSPLRNAGTPSPESAPGHPFPTPLSLPSFHPPAGELLEPGTASVRPVDGTIDVGAFEWTNPTDAPEPARVPRSPMLAQNYPNPFNPSTTIEFRIPGHSYVYLAVFDVLGREVERLVSNELPPGTHRIEWDASGRQSGMYVYRLATGGWTQSRKLLLIK